MDKLEFSQGMKILEEHLLKKGEKITDSNIEIYWSRLKGYSNKIFKKAIMECIDTLKYFPKVVEIKELIEGKPEDEAELAWIYLSEKVDRDGYYNSVSFPKYPAIAGVVEALGGWMEFTESLTDDQKKWVKKEFVKLYPLMKKRGEYPENLPGFFEIENNNKYTEEFMLERYNKKLDGEKVERGKIENKNILPEPAGGE